MAKDLEKIRPLEPDHTYDHKPIHITPSPELDKPNSGTSESVPSSDKDNISTSDKPKDKK